MAGVILVEYYKKNLVVILFYDNSKKSFIDAGGSKSSSDKDIRETAVRELREESCNLFIVNKNILKHSVKLKKHNYTGFFVALEDNNIDLNYYYYYSNLKILKKGKFSKSYLETSGVVRINLLELMNKIDSSNSSNSSNTTTSSSSSKNSFLDVNNNKIKIHNRALELIKEAMKKDIFNKLEISSMSKTKDYLIEGTTSYVL